MEDVIGPSNEIIPDSRTGESSKLETGERRKNNMPEDCMKKELAKHNNRALALKICYPNKGMPDTSKPSSSVKEEKSVTEKDTGAAYTRQFKRKGNTYAP